MATTHPSLGLLLLALGSDVPTGLARGTVTALEVLDDDGDTVIVVRIRGVKTGVKADDGAGPERDHLLTPRELAVAELVAGGLANEAIARALHLSVRTVTSHLDHIYSRLGIHSRASLAVLMTELRLAGGVQVPSGARPTAAGRASPLLPG